MKIYKKMKKRLAKKKLGKDWYFFNYALSIKPGDIVHTCRGYNEIVKEIEIEMFPLFFPSTFKKGKGKLVCDFYVTMESENECSLRNCLDYKWTKERIMEYWTKCIEYKKKNPEYFDCCSELSKKIEKIISDGGCPFDDNGLLIKGMIND